MERENGRPGIDARSAELINYWLDAVDFLPQEVKKYIVDGDYDWEFRKNNDNTIDVIFPNDVVITVDVDLDTEDVAYVKDNVKKSTHNVSKTFDQDFTYEHKIITSIKEFKQYLKVNDN